jgi:hypothetical protein
LLHFFLKSEGVSRPKVAVLDVTACLASFLALANFELAGAMTLFWVSIAYVSFRSFYAFDNELEWKFRPSMACALWLVVMSAYLIYYLVASDGQEFNPFLLVFGGVGIAGLLWQDRHKPTPGSKKKM